MQDPVYEEAYQGHAIKIYHDPDSESPRDWCNLGTLICWHRRYRLGDSHQFESPEVFLRDLADVSDKSELSMDQLRDRAERKAVILPVFLFDHSGLAMNTIGFHCPWDSGQVGYVYVTLEVVRTEFGVKRVTKALRAKAEDILRGEIVTYAAYLGGRVYGYVIEQDGEEIDACWGFVGDYETGCLPEARQAVPVRSPGQIPQSAAAQAQAHP
ncbi:MAG: hypothetical protein CL814_18905 [Confluentimicrobium sp.]|jgi:hypothetical protein|uniref:hypothetical protein n=1 Tax=Actibacterium sp. TaxID=1872125 RepID=UPI000C69B599|nr:hypothetical protein [Actibacterium sp.]MBC58982.1 hypothetical protein [Actibacterium sp.]|tara:strand:- start:161 stop:796 length:636 start_codon:yes stop_codon:yes gene_type:complete